MPTEDVSDLKDVFDAINKLCETMKTSNYSEEDVECGEGLVSPGEVHVRTVETHRAVNWNVGIEEGNVVSSLEDRASQFVSAEDLSVQRMETQRQKWMDSQASLASTSERDVQTSPPSSDVSVARERAETWSDCLVSPPEEETVASDTEPAHAHCEPISELYYTASSEVSLLSDSELPDKEKDSLDKEVVMSGHVAAMRERFESMTRANTPCPDGMRTSSPSLDVIRNVTPSPDLLG